MAEILSVGIDIGTSTTQVIFSQIVMENTAAYFAVPHVSIVDKQIVYKSAVHVTPLLTPVLIDGEGIEDEKASQVLQDRRQMSEEGMFIVSVAVSGGEVIGEPAINSRGFVFDFHRDYNKEMREVIDRAIMGYDLSIGSVDELKRVIKKALRNYLLKKTKQSPMVVPVVVEL